MALQGFLQLDAAHRELIGRCQDILRKRTGLHKAVEVDEVEGFLQVEFPLAGAPVVQAEPQLRTFRHLQERHVLGGMHLSRLDEVGLPCLGLHRMQKFLHAVTFAGLEELIGPDRTLEAQEEPGFGPRGLHIPEGGFAKGVVALLGRFVVRIDVQRGAALHLQALHQHRELRPVPLEGRFSHHPFQIGLHDVAEGVALEPALDGHGIHEAQIGQKIFHLAPGHGLGVRQKLQRRQFLVVHYRPQIFLKSQNSQVLEFSVRRKGTSGFTNSCRRFRTPSRARAENLSHTGASGKGSEKSRAVL